MKIKSLHANIYKLYSWARTQECLDAYRIKHQDVIVKCKNLKQKEYRISLRKKITGVSKSTYFNLCELTQDELCS